MSKDWCNTVAQGIRVTVQIAPNAKKSEVTGLLDDALKLRLQAPPIDGKANDALIRYIAALLDVPKSTVYIAHGHTSRRKVIEIRTSTLTLEQVRQALLSSGK
jgi:uncharacterized protein